MKTKPLIRFRYGQWECGIKNSCYDFVPGVDPHDAYVNWYLQQHVAYCYYCHVESLQPRSK